MVIWDFTGIGIVFALFLTAAVFFLIALVDFVVAVIQENYDFGRVLWQHARPFMWTAICFILLNAFGFLLYLAEARNISHETKRSLEPIMFWGWLPAALIAYLGVTAIVIIIKRKIKPGEIR